MLRVVDDKPENPIATQARAELDRALAEGAVVIGIVWETSDTIGYSSVPCSNSVILGLLLNALHEAKGGTE